MSYQRAATVFMENEINGVTISWIDGTEGTGKRIHSIRTSDNFPTVRIMRDGAESAVDEAPKTGTIVFGSHKWDRPTIDEASKLCPRYAAEILEIHFIPSKFRPFLSIQDCAEILGEANSTIRPKARKLGDKGPEYAYKNGSGWQISYKGLAELRRWPKAGRPFKKLDGPCDG